jgi:hypothetical protein|tara:strand:+ start:1964 stop:2080 length:117 start_codon:yes stop_codon:yes gene_type:complete
MTLLNKMEEYVNQLEQLVMKLQTDVAKLKALDTSPTNE